MDDKQLQKLHSIYFIGIGGISMSGLAEVLNKDGKTVSGSDQALSPITQKLEQLGITIYSGHHADHITKDLDLVVYTAAIKQDNPEFIRAKELNIPLIDRAQLLGLIMQRYNLSIGVSGTHGKTTTTSMLSYILLEGDLDPTISVGGILKGIDGNFRVGHSDYFITEACEYSNSFLQFFPNISIVLNIEEDHLDFFNDLQEIRQSFKHYMENTKENGLIILNDSIASIDELISDIHCPYVIVGSKASSTYSYQNPSFDALGHGAFDLIIKGQYIDTIQLNVTGYHNIENALAAIAASRFMGIPLETIKKGLLSFGGADRRFEIKGVFNGITVIDDYAHHPTEIKTTLEAIKHVTHNQLWVVFQPHTFTRTKSLFNEFVDALKDVEHLIITDIYAAREQDPGDIHSKMLVESLSKFGKEIVYIADFENICAYLKAHCMPNDMLITMGAGNVNSIGMMMLGT
jgi:UDP-N-acetylmuramate--alanine ligase